MAVRYPNIVQSCVAEDELSYESILYILSYRTGDNYFMCFIILVYYGQEWAFSKLYQTHPHEMRVTVLMQLLHKFTLW